MADLLSKNSFTFLRKYLCHFLIFTFNDSNIRTVFVGPRRLIAWFGDMIWPNDKLFRFASGKG